MTNQDKNLLEAIAEYRAAKEELLAVSVDGYGTLKWLALTKEKEALAAKVAALGTAL